MAKVAIGELEIIFVSLDFPDFSEVNSNMFVQSFHMRKILENGRN